MDEITASQNSNTANKNKYNNNFSFDPNRIAPSTYEGYERKIDVLNEQPEYSIQFNLRSGTQAIHGGIEGAGTIAFRLDQSGKNVVIPEDIRSEEARNAWILQQQEDKLLVKKGDEVLGQFSKEELEKGSIILKLGDDKTIGITRFNPQARLIEVYSITNYQDNVFLTSTVVPTQDFHGTTISSILEEEIKKRGQSIEIPLEETFTVSPFPPKSSQIEKPANEIAQNTSSNLQPVKTVNQLSQVSRETNLLSKDVKLQEEYTPYISTPPVFKIPGANVNVVDINNGSNFLPNTQSFTKDKKEKTEQDLRKNYHLDDAKRKVALSIKRIIYPEAYGLDDRIWDIDYLGDVPHIESDLLDRIGKYSISIKNALLSLEKKNNISSFEQEQQLQKPILDKASSPLTKGISENEKVSSVSVSISPTSQVDFKTTQSSKTPTFAEENVDSKDNEPVQEQPKPEVEKKELEPEYRVDVFNEGDTPNDLAIKHLKEVMGKNADIPDDLRRVLMFATTGLNNIKSPDDIQEGKGYKYFSKKAVGKLIEMYQKNPNEVIFIKRDYLTIEDVNKAQQDALKIMKELSLEALKEEQFSQNSDKAIENNQL